MVFLLDWRRKATYEEVGAFVASDKADIGFID